MGIANWLTCGRIAAVPVLLLLFLVAGPLGEALRLVVFVAAAVTDWLDGRVARASGTTSRLGAALDPAADKMLVLGTLLLLTAQGGIAGAAVVAVAAILLREVLISGLREAGGRAGEPVQTLVLAKWKTAAQMTALAILLAGSLAGRIHPLLPGLGVALLWVAALLSVVTGGIYVRQIWRGLNR